MITQNGAKADGETLTVDDALDLAYFLGRIEGKIDGMLTGLDAPDPADAMAA